MSADEQGYTLPKATTTTLGGVIVGDNLTIDADGKLNGPKPGESYTLPLATSGTRGGVKIGFTKDTTNKKYPVELLNEQMFVQVPWENTVYTLPLAASGTRGGIQLGFTKDTTNKKYPVELDGEKAFVQVPWEAGGYTLPLASSTTRGGVKIGYTQSGKNYPVQLSNEMMYVNVPWTDTTYTLPKATTSTLGGVKVGDGLSVSDGTVSLSAATTTSIGGVKIGSGLNVSSGVASLKAPTSASLVGTDANGELIDASSALPVPRIGTNVTYGSIDTGAFESTTKTIYTISGVKYVNVSVDINGNTSSKCYLIINGNVVAYYARVHDGYSSVSWSGIATGSIQFQATTAKIQNVQGTYCVNNIVYD